jgi:hypothetical protein
VETGEEEAVMRIVISEFLTLDGVMQAPGGSEEDRSEGFEHGGWQLDNGYFDDVGGQVVTEAFQSSDGMFRAGSKAGRKSRPDLEPLFQGIAADGRGAIDVLPADPHGLAVQIV